MPLRILIATALGVLTLQAGAGEPANTLLPESVQTQRAGFKVHVAKAAAGVPQNRMQRWVVHVDDAQGRPVTGASIQVSGGMPEHGRGFATAPAVTELRAGDYAVNGLKFHMPGYWEIAFDIRAGKVSDRAQFHIHLE